jgi:hypothetical protein
MSFWKPNKIINNNQILRANNKIKTTWETVKVESGKKINKSNKEGPGSRRYGRTAALRLPVQPCDEDDDDHDYFFIHFLVMEHRWNEIDGGKPKYSGKNLSQCHFVHHKSHMD